MTHLGFKTVRFRRPPPTAADLSTRPDYDKFRFHRHESMKARGVSSTRPVTVASMEACLFDLCGVQKVSSPDVGCEKRKMDMLDSWKMIRLSESELLSPGCWNGLRGLPIFALHPPQGAAVERIRCPQSAFSRNPAAHLHVPPLLPLPAKEELSIGEYLDFIRPLTTHAQTVPGFLRSPDDVAPSKHLPQLDVGVVLASREEMSFFTATSYHDHFQFVEPPKRWMSEEFFAQRGVGESVTDFAKRHIQASAEALVSSLHASQAFAHAGTWWCRVDAAVRPMMEEAFSAALKVSPHDDKRIRITLGDPRWASLPRARVLKNSKWTIDPEFLAGEMKYGLLEIFETKSW